MQSNQGEFTTAEILANEVGGIVMMAVLAVLVLAVLSVNRLRR